MTRYQKTLQFLVWATLPYSSGNEFKSAPDGSTCC
jgi:hypothetical protein